MMGPGDPGFVERRAVTSVHEVDRDRPGLRFSPEVSAGHLLTIAGFMLSAAVGGVSAYAVIDKRLILLEQNTALQSQIDKTQDAMQAAALQRISESLAEIKAQLRGAR